MKMIYNLLATLFCIITLGIIDVEIKYSDGTKFKYISWIHIFYKKDYEKVVRCKDCKYCTVHNSPTLYAYCEKTHFRFEPFETDTRTHFCNYGERK